VSGAISKIIMGLAMNRLLSVWTSLTISTLVLAGSSAYGQSERLGDDPRDVKSLAAPRNQGLIAEPPAGSTNNRPLITKSPYRQLAPGVLVSIDPIRRFEETTSRHDVVGCSRSSQV